MKDIHARQQLTIDSYIVIYGPTLENVSAAYVVKGDVTYQASNVNLAVDICFQSMKVFDKKFSHVFAHVWQLTEHVVYGFQLQNM